MNLPWQLTARVLVALGFAAAAIAVLSYAVEAADEPAKLGLRAQRAPAKEARSLLAPPRHKQSLGFDVAPLDGALALVASEAALPPDVAPVVEVLAGGGLALRRARPLAEGPAPVGPSRDGYGAGLVLPGPSLVALAPGERAALLGLLERWFPERPVALARLEPIGVEASAADLQRLLRWLP